MYRYRRDSGTAPVNYTLVGVNKADDDFTSDNTTSGRLTVGSSGNRLGRPPRRYRLVRGHAGKGQGVPVRPRGSRHGSRYLESPESVRGFQCPKRFRLRHAGFRRHQAGDLRCTGERYLLRGGGDKWDRGGQLHAVCDGSGGSRKSDATTTGRLTVGSSMPGTIDFRGDRDWFKVELEEEQTYRIDVTGGSYVVGIYDSERHPATGDGGWQARREWRQPGVVHRGQRLPPTLSRSRDMAPEPNTRCRRPFLPRTITRPTSTAGVPSENEGEEDAFTNGRVVVGEPATGTMEHYLDRDWFAVDLEADTTYRFELREPREGSRDPGLRLVRGMTIYSIRGEDGSSTDNGVEFTWGWPFRTIHARCISPRAPRTPTMWMRARNGDATRGITPCR